MSKDIDFTGKLAPNSGQNPKYMSNYSTGNAPTGTQHGARYVVNATGLQVSSFGTKASQQPTIWEQFKNGSNGQSINSYDSNWPNYGGYPTAKITTNNPRYAGSKSALNDLSQHEFSTNYKKFTPTDAVYANYWIYLDGEAGTDYVQWKHSRITTDTDSGGGGVYNGVGSSAMSRFILHNLTQTQLDYSGTAGGATAWPPEVPVRQWYQVRSIVKIGGVDASNGKFHWLFGGFGSPITGSVRDNINWNGTPTMYNSGTTYAEKAQVGFVKPTGTDSGVIHIFSCKNDNTIGIPPMDANSVVSSSWTLLGRQNFKFNAFLLGLMMANSRKYYTVNTVTDDTTYTVTINGTAYPINSGVGATATSIMTALVTAVTNGGVHYAEIRNGQIYAAVSSGAGVTQGVFDSKFTVRTTKVYISDVYVDTSLSRFEVGDNAVYSNCTILEPQPYTLWSSSQVKLSIQSPVWSGNKYLFFTDVNNVTYALGQMQSNGVHNA